MWACRVARVPDAADDLDDPNILSLVGRDRFGRQIGDSSQTPVRSQEAVNRRG